MTCRVRDSRQITFEFLNRICLLRGWGGVKANLLRIGKLQTEIFVYGKCFHEILYHQTNINPTKIKEIITRYTYSIPSIGIVNLANFKIPVT